MPGKPRCFLFIWDPLPGTWILSFMSDTEEWSSGAPWGETVAALISQPIGSQCGVRIHLSLTWHYLQMWLSRPGSFCPLHLAGDASLPPTSKEGCGATPTGSWTSHCVQGKQRQLGRNLAGLCFSLGGTSVAWTSFWPKWTLLYWA